MKKRLSHFAYNERSRSAWTLTIPRLTSLSPIRSTIKLLPMSPARSLPLSPVCTKGDRGGFECGFNHCYRLEFLNELLRHYTRNSLQKSMAISVIAAKAAIQSTEFPGFRLALS